MIKMHVHVEYRAYTPLLGAPQVSQRHEAASWVGTCFNMNSCGPVRIDMLVIFGGFRVC